MASLGIFGIQHRFRAEAEFPGRSGRCQGSASDTFGSEGGKATKRVNGGLVGGKNLSILVLALSLQ